jgi:hypothetical protein
MLARSVADEKSMEAWHAKTDAENCVAAALQEGFSLEEIFHTEAAQNWAESNHHFYTETLQTESDSTMILTRSQLGKEGEGHYQITAHAEDVDLRTISNGRSTGPW